MRQNRKRPRERSVVIMPKVSRRERKTLVGVRKCIINMLKFGEIEIESKKFKSVYQVQKDVDCGKIRIGEGVAANEHDTRYTIGYETEPGVIVPLYVKTPKDCLSSGVSRFNEASPWNMGFNVSEDEAWVKDYEAIWITIEECLLKKRLEGKPLSNEKYINPKLITWDHVSALVMLRGFSR